MNAPVSKGGPLVAGQALDASHDDATDAPILSARTLMALVRLQDSRQRLSRELLPNDHQAHGDGDPDGSRPRGGQGLWSAWAERLGGWLRQTPLAPVWSTAREVHAQWWSRHSWRPGAEAAGDALGRQVLPWVRRHPGWAVGVSAALGAALFVARPWSRPWVRAQAGKARGRVGSWLARELRAIPFQALIPVLLAAWSARTASQASTQADSSKAETVAERDEATVAAGRAASASATAAVSDLARAADGAPSGAAPVTPAAAPAEAPPELYPKPRPADTPPQLLH